LARTVASVITNEFSVEGNIMRPAHLVEVLHPADPRRPMLTPQMDAICTSGMDLCPGSDECKTHSHV
jgi:hypothetical protein